VNKVAEKEKRSLNIPSEKWKQNKQEDNIKKYVWYAGYGSNLSEDRFLCYIKGGKPKYANEEGAGCKDQSLPLKDKPISIYFSLYFAKNSSNWVGAVAFIGTKENKKGKPTLGRMWLITEEQFKEIRAQEGTSWYNKKIELGKEEGMSIYTITHSAQLSFEKPSENYLKTIIGGLKETYPEMSTKELVEYLLEKEGIKGKYTEKELAKLTSE